MRPLWVVGMGLAGMAVLGWLVAQLALPLARDWELAGAGALAPWSVAEPRCSTALVVHLCRVAVRYEAGGVRRNAEVSFLTTLAHPITGQFRVRYDPGAPERFATSWGAAAMGNRLQTLGIALLGGAGFVWVMWQPALALGRAWRLRGVPLRPVAATIEDMRPGTEATRFSLSWTDDGAVRRATARLPPKAGPWWLGEARGHVAALVGEDGQAVVLDAGLQEAGLREADRAALRAALPAVGAWVQRTGSG